MFFYSKFFTWNEESKGCGIRRFAPTNYIRVPGQSSATRNGEVLEGLLLVGFALTTEDQKTCLEVCHLDDHCQSCSFNDETSDNPLICVLNYGPTERTISVGPNSGISSASKNC